MVLPFGRHDGATSSPGPLVTRWTYLPFAVITQTRYGPVRLLEKAILVPSGDHVGYASAAGEVVSRR